MNEQIGSPETKITSRVEIVNSVGRLAYKINKHEGIKVLELGTIANNDKTRSLTSVDTGEIKNALIIHIDPRIDPKNRIRIRGGENSIGDDTKFLLYPGTLKDIREKIKVDLVTMIAPNPDLNAKDGNVLSITKEALKVLDGRPPILIALEISSQQAQNYLDKSVSAVREQLRSVGYTDIYDDETDDPSDISDLTREVDENLYSSINSDMTTFGYRIIWAT